jgi:hypothetical protein
LWIKRHVEAEDNKESDKVTCVDVGINQCRKKYNWVLFLTNEENAIAHSHSQVFIIVQEQGLSVVVCLVAICQESNNGDSNSRLR